MAFKAQYPKAPTLASCILCHQVLPATVNNLNPYGLDYLKANYSFVAIEGLDSDGDGFTNIVEINVGTWPGDKTSHPANASVVNDEDHSSIAIF